MSDAIKELLTCKGKDCGGQISDAMAIRLQTGCGSFTPAFPCRKCGLLHSGAINGSQTFQDRHSEELAYFINGELTLRPE